MLHGLSQKQDQAQLRNAIKAANVLVVQTAIDAGADIHCRGYCAPALLYEATEHGYLEAVKWLAEQGALATKKEQRVEIAPDNQGYDSSVSCLKNNKCNL